MSEKSICGSMPWLNRFIPSVTRQTLPVRSPCPNRQPSTRSAPAIIASSVAATAVPRSLCGCRLIVVCSRRVSWRENHSIWSAYTFGVATSIVAGRFRMISRPSSGCHTSETASQTSAENGSSVLVKISGEYS